MASPNELASWLKSAHRAVFFTGAGMSTESGLPDFRSNGGLWKQHRRFEALASVTALESDYDEFVAFYRWRIEQLAQYRPHRGHALIAEWQKRGMVSALITQNVDGFHEQAGSPTPLNLHGSLAQVRCQRCGTLRPATSFLAPAGTSCDCGGRMRPGVVLFGESLAEETLAQAIRVSNAADLFVVLGSSLAVSPANTLPLLAKRAGARLAIVNRDPTPLDEVADWTCARAIGEVLSEVAVAL